MSFLCQMLSFLLTVNIHYFYILKLIKIKSLVTCKKSDMISGSLMLWFKLFDSSWNISGFRNLQKCYYWSDFFFFFFLKVSCSPQGLKVWVQDTSYLCSRAGQVLPVSIQMNGWIHDGNLLCPSCWDFCELCPPETDPPAINLTRALPLGE